MFLTRFIRYIFIFSCLFALQAICSENSYLNYESYTAKLNSISKKYKNVSLNSAGKTHAGLEIWQLTLGDQDHENKPALLLVGGVGGNDLISTEILLNVFENLAESYGRQDSIAEILQNHTFYVFPRLNPDAAEFYFSKVQFDQNLNSRSVDLDKDGTAGEDGPDDLNGDGLITQMRIEDPEGQWVADTLITQLMRKASAEKGEAGRYKLITEGIDNDKDGVLNEDGTGGVHLNKNFSYQYRFFKTGTGPHAVSEPETRALVDFAFAHQNISAVFSFSSQDNLNHPPKVEKKKPATKDGGRRNRKPIEKIFPADARFVVEIAKTYKELTGFSEAPKPVKGEGSLANWAYYHFGRWSFSAPAWWTPRVKLAADTTLDKVEVKSDGEETKKAKTDKKQKTALKKEKDVLEAEKNMFRWLEKTGLDGFVEWTEIDHPDFPDQTVEVGGFKPFINLNPPADSIAVLSEKYGKFFIQLTDLLPKTSLETKVEALSKNVYRLTAFIKNEGFLPSSTQLGQKVQWVRKLQVELTPGKNQILKSGQKRIRIDGLKGSGDTRQLSWIVVAEKGSKIPIRAGSPNTGFVEETVVLK